MPRLAGARAIGAAVLGPRAVTARWRLGDGSTWALWVNLDVAPVTLDAVQCAAAARGTALFALQDAARSMAREGVLPAHGVALLRAPAGEGAR